MLNVADIIYKEYCENFSNNPDYKARQTKACSALNKLIASLNSDQEKLLDEFLNIRGNVESENEFELVNFVLDFVRQIFTGNKKPRV